MIELKNEKIAVPVVLFAGLLWSFGPLVVKIYGSTTSCTMAIYIW